MSKFSHLLAPVLGIASAVAATAPASAIVIRDDRAGQAETFGQTTLDFTGAVRLNGVLSGSGTLISPRHILTAGHISASRNQPGDVVTVQIGGATRTVTTISVVSRNATGGDDIAVYELDAPITSVAPAPLYTGSRFALQGQTLAYSGVGRGGVGSTGAVGGTDGILRGGTNVADSLGLIVSDGNGGTTTYSDNIVFADFDQPGTTQADNTLGSIGSSTIPEDLEIGTAPNDSGGGLFTLVNGQYQIAGVHSFVLLDGDGISFNYGDVPASTAIEANLGFIQAAIPEPASLMLLAVTAPLLLRRRSRPI